jgi:hypothetical protein
VALPIQDVDPHSGDDMTAKKTQIITLKGAKIAGAGRFTS